jgi:hypothetical protein
MGSWYEQGRVHLLRSNPDITVTQTGNCECEWRLETPDGSLCFTGRAEACQAGMLWDKQAKKLMAGATVTVADLVSKCRERLALDDQWEQGTQEWCEAVGRMNHELEQLCDQLEREGC